jgi:hypothetical protein
LNNGILASIPKMLMVRLLYILGIGAILGASALIGLWLRERGRHSPQLEETCNRPGAVQMFKAQANRSGARPAEVSPLVLQAEAFSRHLNPPKDAERPSAPAERLPRFARNDMASSVPPVRPPAPSPRFKLRGTSYYPNQPRKSMALISDLGSAEGNDRWVKEGTQLGHFVIQEIRRGAIVYRDGDNLREMAVEHSAGPPGIVRDIRPGTRRVSAAVGGEDALTPISAGPNSIEIAGGN